MGIKVAESMLVCNVLVPQYVQIMSLILHAFVFVTTSLHLYSVSLAF